MNNGKNPDRERASTSAPRRVEKVGEVQLIEDSAGRLAITVPIRIKQRGRRKLVTLPSGETVAPKRPWDDAPTPMQLALARRHRWLAMLDKSARSGFGPRSGPRRGEPQGWGEQSGQVGSLREIADKEGVDNSYVSRIINLRNL